MKLGDSLVLTVNDVMTESVIATEVNESVKNAAREMAKFGISSLLVFSEEGLKGILTERDIITRVVCAGLDPSDIRVGDVMSEPVIVVAPGTPLERAVELMLLHHIKKLPILAHNDDEYNVCGILSLMDVARLHPDLVNTMKSLIEVDMNSPEAGFYVS
ncbi:CBS domain-containing protein [Candidatus Bathyarchaeota archaeon]|nr:CBS domain-containing protein [Candidatus Bathyarchaeota archaeon]